MDKKEMMIVATKENSKKSFSEKLNEKLNKKYDEIIEKHPRVEDFMDWLNDCLNDAYLVFIVIDQRLNNLCRNFTRLVVIAFLVSILGHYCPEVASKFPVVFQFFNGVIEFFNFILITTLKGIKALCTLNFREFNLLSSEVSRNFWILLSQFSNWISQITFQSILINFNFLTFLGRQKNIGWYFNQCFLLFS